MVCRPPKSESLITEHDVMFLGSVAVHAFPPGRDHEGYRLLGGRKPRDDSEEGVLRNQQKRRGPLFYAYSENIKYQLTFLSGRALRGRIKSAKYSKRSEGYSGNARTTDTKNGRRRFGQRPRNSWDQASAENGKSRRDRRKKKARTPGNSPQQEGPRSLDEKSALR